MSFFLSEPGVISSAGDGLAASWAAVNRPEPCSLMLRSDLVGGRTLPAGVVTASLRPVPDDIGVPASHNNRLLWHACSVIEPSLRAAVQRYGRSRIAVVLGTSTGGVDENYQSFRFVADGGSWRDCGFDYVSQCLASPADFLQACYRLQGPAYVVSTACTSGARALMSAARLIRANLADAVVCGGVDSLSVLTVNGFASLGVLADIVATPFAPGRQGINIGEGAAVFVMSRDKLLSDAEPLGLSGYGGSSDAWHMSGPRPDGAGAEAAVRAALAYAGLQPADIGWINLHGTGTVHNDAMESTAVYRCFSDAIAGTSTKPHTGHTLAAAGALEAAFCWAAVSRKYNSEGRLPPQYLPFGRDHDLPPVLLADSQSRLPESERRQVLSTSFAFGGSNTALIIGDQEG